MTSDREAAARAAHQPGERLIGDRTCTNCGARLFDHCELHLIPCCPGTCPGRRRRPGGNHGGGRPRRERA